jgi:hypothetical protein
VIEQLTLDGKTEDPAVKLTERQRFALNLIGQLGPAPSDELGAHMHARRGKHGADQRCEWCAREGKGIGAELLAKNLVKQRRGEGWVLVGAIASARESTSGYDPATAAFPEGF